MALATRCPHCQTSFKVANDQLKLHAGLVRCGSCNQTFNGIEHLIPLENPAVPASASPKSPVATPSAFPTATSANTETVFSAVIPPSTQRNTETIPSSSAPVQQATPSIAATAAPGITEDELVQSDAPPARTLKAVKSVKAEAESSSISLQEPSPIVSSASLDFDLGDLAEQPLSDEATLAQVELETRAALMSQPTVDWSVSEGDSEEEPAFSTHTGSEPELGDIGSNTLDKTPTPLSDSGSENREPYIADLSEMSDAALAENSDTPAQDSISDIVSDKVSDAIASDSYAGNQDNEAEADEHEHLPDFVVQAEKNKGRQRVTRIVMVVLSLLLLPLLFAQSVYVLRVQLAAWFPETRPMLVQACQLIHCQIGLPMQIDQISMESNELQAVAPEKNLFLLAIQLQNSSSTVQTWPVVELILNDAKDKPVLQRAFAPADYLADPADISKGFTAGTEQNIKLYFELPKLNAAGYRVGYFYP